jgi:hypothetical protein
VRSSLCPMASSGYSVPSFQNMVPPPHEGQEPFSLSFRTSEVTFFKVENYPLRVYPEGASVFFITVTIHKERAYERRYTGSRCTE